MEIEYDDTLENCQKDSVSDTRQQEMRSLTTARKSHKLSRELHQHHKLNINQLRKLLSQSLVVQIHYDE